MVRKLIQYLPPFMQEYKEMQVLQDALDPEVQELWKLSGDMLKEAFIETESEYGAKRWEGILGLRPKDTDSLETRNVRILAKINETLPYTIPTLMRFLNSAIGKEFYELRLDAVGYQLELLVLLGQLGKVREVMSYMEQIVPVNLLLLYVGRQTGDYEVKTTYATRFTARGDFYPRYNLEYLYLDNSWALDQAYELSGYKIGSQLDFYPASLKTVTGIEASPGIRNVLTVENDLWYLDDTWAMDGTMLLDAEIFYYVL